MKVKEFSEVAKKGGPFSFCEENFKKKHILDFCETTLLRNLFIEGGDPVKKCKRFKKPSKCLKAVSVHLYERKGIESKEDLCSLVPDAKIKSYCQEEIAYRENFTFEMLNNCSSNEAKGFVPERQCELNAINNFKKNKIKEEVCSFIKYPKERKNCFKNTMFMHAALGNLEKCSLLKGDDNKECHKVYKDFKIKMGLRGGLSTLFVDTHLKKLEKKEKRSSFKGEKLKKAKSLKLSPFYKSKNLTIQSFPYFERSKGNAFSTLFQKIEGPEIGLSYSYGFSILENFEPFKYGKGISSGDFNNDLWPDIAVATETGVQLYQNLGNGRFQRVPFNPKTKGIPFLTTLVDINNDGWKDLYISSYGGLNHFYLNQKGIFEEEGLDLSDPDNVILTMSGAFSDIDRDGDIDFVQGNWSYGAYNFRRLKVETSMNRIFLNTGTKGKIFKRSHFKDNLKGETLSTLLTDINQDGKVDLFTGNDFSIPDGLYLGQDKGKFQKIKKSDKIIPLISKFTMSFDSADINNDLHLDLFSAEMAFVGNKKDDNYCDSIKNKFAKSKCQNHFSIRRVSRKRDIEKCSQYKGETNKNCLFSMMIGIMTESKDTKNCDKIPTSLKEARIFCQRLFDLKKIQDQT
ncbi:MAG: VCBS repeat-containing protein, partial [Bdellovibrionota bacterium]|nr:VCBS repeat-containing protein [Bdellovibrionota bacterium]